MAAQHPANTSDRPAPVVEEAIQGSLLARVRHRLGDGVSANIAALYGSLIVYYIVPLATVPYLFRVLGPAAWGTIAMAQGLGSYLFLIVDYSFGLSATREVARQADCPERLAEIFAGVSGAKALLSALCLAVAIPVAIWVPAMQANRSLLWAGVIQGLAMGWYPLWFFLGRKQLKMVATVDIILKVLAASGVFFIVRRPSDAWRVLALQAAGSVASTTVGMFLAYREIRFRWPDLRMTSQTLKDGWTMFLMRSSSMLYTTGNSYLLGMFAPIASVGYFAGAEKLTKAFTGILNPFNQAMYPRMAKLVGTGHNSLRPLIRLNAAVLAGGGMLIGLGMFVAAPLIVRIVLGPSLGPAVPILRIFSLLPALVGLNLLLGNQWMIPHGLESSLQKIYLRSAILNLAMACLLAPRFYGVGMAWSVLSAEFYTAVASLVVIRKKRHTLELQFRPRSTPVSAVIE